ncbi:hypothetical protein C8Q76DRAFT_210265 [Earliella scabrosa]|nr:hypothetical protein C8Q76DRAFT_210265 [Earliella scabrosa]
MERSRLPVEVCERIIDLAAINPPYDTRYDGTESIVDYQTLLACVLVCHAWRPRARYHLFYRVIVDSPKHLNLFLTAAENGVHARELELSLPLETGVLYEGRPRHGDQFGVSFAAPAFAQAVNHVKLLILSKTEWLYPRKYIGILASCFSSLTALDLCRTYFPTGGDLARLLWSFPRLCYLECNEVGVTCGGMSRLPTPARTSEPQSFPRIATLTVRHHW